MYFPEHKLAIEADEKGYTDKDKKKRNLKSRKNKKRTWIKFIRINPDPEKCDIFNEIGKTVVYIAQSNKEAEITNRKEKIEKKEAEIKEIKEKLEKEKEAEIKEIKYKSKELKMKIKNLTTNPLLIVVEK